MMPIGDGRVQHVSKASSDQLLRKFDDLGSNKRSLGLIDSRGQLIKRLRRGGGEGTETDEGNRRGGVGERRVLLPQVTGRSGQSTVGRKWRMVMERRDTMIRSKTVLVTVKKTWRKTVHGASRMFIEKHYNRHKRLINGPIIV